MKAYILVIAREKLFKKINSVIKKEYVVYFYLTFLLCSYFVRDWNLNSFVKSTDSL